MKSARIFTVISKDRSVGLLPKPDAGMETCGHLRPGETFEVIGELSYGGRRFLHLADGRGWVPESSRKDPTRVVVAEETEAQQQNKTAPSSIRRRGRGKKKQPRVPRERRQRLKGGPAGGALVGAALKRSNACSRGYCLQASFELPDGRSFATKRRVIEEAPALAPRLFMTYRHLQGLLLRDWNRMNVLDEKRNVWKRRPVALPVSTAVPAIKGIRKAAKRKARALAPKSASPALAISDGALALENGALALEDDARSQDCGRSLALCSDQAADSLSGSASSTAALPLATLSVLCDSPGSPSSCLLRRTRAASVPICDERAEIAELPGIPTMQPLQGPSLQQLNLSMLLSESMSGQGDSVPLPLCDGSSRHMTGQAAPGAFREGCRVRVEGLISEAGQKLNGQLGTVITEEASGRLIVELDAAGRKALKVENLAFAAWPQPETCVEACGSQSGIGRDVNSGGSSSGIKSNSTGPPSTPRSGGGRKRASSAGLRTPTTGLGPRSRLRSQIKMDPANKKRGQATGQASSGAHQGSDGVNAPAVPRQLTTKQSDRERAADRARQWLQGLKKGDALRTASER